MFPPVAGRLRFARKAHESTNFSPLYIITLYIVFVNRIFLKKRQKVLIFFSEYDMIYVHIYLYGRVSCARVNIIYKGLTNEQIQKDQQYTLLHSSRIPSFSMTTTWKA